MEIQKLRENKYFDEQPNFDCKLDQINLDLAKELFAKVSKKLTDKSVKSLGLVVEYHAKECPSNAAILLFADQPKDYFPDAVVRLGRFLGIDKTKIIDQQTLEVPISIALEPITAFIQRHTSMAAEITGLRRKDIPQYDPVVIREAMVNALLHMDYAIKGASIQVAIFDDRIEITNPGCLPFGLSLEKAVSGISQLRNRVIGRVFRELELIEQWGSGLGRIVSICQEKGIPSPKLEEIGNFFRVTLYHSFSGSGKIEWDKMIVDYLKMYKEIAPKKAQKLWGVTSRTTSTRLKKMSMEGVIFEISKGPFDPRKKFILKN